MKTSDAWRELSLAGDAIDRAKRELSHGQILRARVGTLQAIQHAKAATSTLRESSEIESRQMARQTSGESVRLF